MACQPVADLIPKSLLGVVPLETLLKKIPQVNVAAAKDWKGMKAIQAILWLSNPSNLSAIQQAVKDFSDLGNLANIMFLANLLQYMGISGFVDLSKLDSSAMQKVTDALDCVTKNIDALQQLETGLMQTVQSALNTANIYQMLGISQAMDQLGVTDSYLFSELNAKINNTFGISQLANMPGINGTVPIPYSITQAVTTVYVANSLTQTIGYLSMAQNNPQAQSVLQAVGEMANTLDPKTLNISQSKMIPTDPAAAIMSVKNGVPVSQAFIQGQTDAQAAFQDCLSQSTSTDASNVQDSQAASDATLPVPEGC